MLREYQRSALDALYAWFSRGNNGNPCVVLPTGAGKSHVLAALCKEALQNWPSTRVLMLTHVKELIEQNAEKMRIHWPEAPMGIYSAGIGKRQIGEPITFAGIQSVRDKAAQLGHIDLVVIDECHLVSHKNEGVYRQLINGLTAINPHLRVVGLTATPFRLGHGMIAGRGALFSDIIDTVSIGSLIAQGYLCPLRSKVTTEKLDIKGVQKRGGEYIESQLQAAVNKPEKTMRAVAESLVMGEGRKSLLYFCAGVEHAENVCRVLTDLGISAACITGKTPKAERESILKDFKEGNIRALTNANVLTTGFDHPGIDMIVMLRPTMSPGLYMQMAGRGLRVSPSKNDCLVLDFAGVIAQHGPITNVITPEKKGDGTGEAPVKVCDKCHEIVHLSIMTCPSCGEPFPPSVRKLMRLRDDDIMGGKQSTMNVSAWAWRQHVSKTSGNHMVKVIYYGSMTDAPVQEFLPLLNEGYAGQSALNKLAAMAQSSGANLPSTGGLFELCCAMNNATPPKRVGYVREGRYKRVTERVWDDQQSTE